MIDRKAIGERVHRLLSRLSIPGWLLWLWSLVGSLLDVKDLFELARKLPYVGILGDLTTFVSHWGWALGALWLTAVAVWPKREPKEKPPPKTKSFVVTSAEIDKHSEISLEVRNDTGFEVFGVVFKHWMETGDGIVSMGGPVTGLQVMWSTEQLEPGSISRDEPVPKKGRRSVSWMYHGDQLLEQRRNAGERFSKYVRIGLSVHYRFSTQTSRRSSDSFYYQIEYDNVARKRRVVECKL